MTKDELSKYANSIVTIQRDGKSEQGTMMVNPAKDQFVVIVVSSPVAGVQITSKPIVLSDAQIEGAIVDAETKRIRIP